MARELKNMRSTTCRPTENGGFEMVYHQTTVFSCHQVEKRQANPVGRSIVRRVVLNTGEHKTVTTKARINWCFDQADIPARVYQKDWDWFIELTTKSFSEGDGPRDGYERETKEFDSECVVFDFWTELEGTHERGYVLVWKWARVA